MFDLKRLIYCFICFIVQQQSVNGFTSDPGSLNLLSYPPTYRSSHPSFFGQTINFDANSSRLVVGRARDNSSTPANGVLFSCPYTSLQTINVTCDVIKLSNTTSPDEKFESVSVAYNDGNIAACFSLNPRKCGKDVASLGLCLRPGNGSNEWENLDGNNHCTDIPDHVYLMFIVDGSSSVSAENFVKVKSWIANVTNQVNFTTTSLGVLQFSKYKETSKIEIPLGSETTFEDFRAKLEAMAHHSRSATNTAYALQFATEEFKRAYIERNTTATDETFARYAVVITDGVSSGTKEFLSENVVLLQSENVEIMAIGIGNYDGDELEIMASAKEDIYELENFEDLQGIVDSIVVKFNPVAGEGSSESTELRLLQKGFSSIYSPVR